MSTRSHPDRDELRMLPYSNVPASLFFALY
jgi:hypothetical protein